MANDQPVDQISAEEQKQQEDNKKKQNVMHLIYDKINEVLGAGDQLFSMQFPGSTAKLQTFSV